MQLVKGHVVLGFCAVFSISVFIFSHLLTNSGYQLEKCTIPETGRVENCVISLPREMENINTSSSEVTDGYSSEANESTKFENNVEVLSDWDELLPVKEIVIMQEGAASSSLTPTEPKKPDPLFDSGYLKSPSPQETVLKLPQLALQENVKQQESSDREESDRFDEVVSTPSLSSDDNKLHLKKTIAKEKFVGPTSPDNNRVKLDPNRVNELDRYHSLSMTKTFMNNHLKPQNEFKKSPFRDHHSVAGPSSIARKKKAKDKKPCDKKDLEPSPVEDAKSIANCIIQNSLNRIDVGDEPVLQVELIKDLSPPIEEIQDFAEERAQEAREPPFEVPPEPALPLLEVENGDLANNNRDYEGNNFVANNVQDQDIDEGIDLLNDNLEEVIVPLLEDNVNAFDNNNDLMIGENEVEQEPQVVQEYAEAGEVFRQIEVGEALAEPAEIAHASREALFDENSEQDLLEDFDIPPQADQDNVLNLLDLGNNVVLVGIQPVSSDGSRNEPGAVAGTHVATEEVEGLRPRGPDEPHFYCQGDGLGVHPSVIAVDIDEVDDEADNETTTSDSSSNNTADYAEIEPGPSEMFDMSSLPEESSLAITGTNSLEGNEGNLSVSATGEAPGIPENHSVVWINRGLNDGDASEAAVVNDIIRNAVSEVERIREGVSRVVSEDSAHSSSETARDSLINGPSSARNGLIFEDLAQNVSSEFETVHRSILRTPHASTDLSHSRQAQNSPGNLHVIPKNTYSTFEPAIVISGIGRGSEYNNTSVTGEQQEFEVHTDSSDNFDSANEEL